MFTINRSVMALALLASIMMVSTSHVAQAADTDNSLAESWVASANPADYAEDAYDIFEFHLTD
ncbi:MAG: hypothetical protein VW268_13695 [Rhodospirillaceae bacterium]